MKGIKLLHPNCNFFFHNLGKIKSWIIANIIVPIYVLPLLGWNLILNFCIPNEPIMLLLFSNRAGMMWVFMVLVRFQPQIWMDWQTVESS